MARVQKFLFDRDFDLPEPVDEDQQKPSPGAANATLEDETPPAPTFSEEEMEDARRQAFENGREQGLLAARDEVEALLGAAIEDISGQLGRILDAHQHGLEASQKEAVELAMSVVSKLFPELNRRCELDEIVALIEGLLPYVLEKPKIVIRVPKSLTDDLHKRISPITERMGLKGRVTVLGDETLTNGRSGIDWVDGGAERDVVALKAAIDAKIVDYLSASAAPQEPNEDPEEI